MTTLREQITENVGSDVATPDYFRELGYNEALLDTEITLVFQGYDATVWDVGSGYHVSTNTSEEYSEDPVEDGFCRASDFYKEMWNPTAETWLVVDEQGANMYEAKVQRHGTGWLHVDEMDGYSFLTQEDVDRLILVPAEE